MDSNSREILKNVHPKQRELVTKLVESMITLGYDARVTQGLRTAAEQQKLYNQGRTAPGKRVTNALPWQSNHNYGLANDITIYKNGKPDWFDLKPYQILGREAERLGLEWGGRWKAVDMPHVQLRGMSVKECQKFYRQGGISAVWDRMSQILSGAKPTVFIPKENELLEFGDKGAAVESLQKDLAKLGLLRSHEIDGEFGKITKNAVMAFQRQNNLTADGIVGPGTKAKIQSALARKSEVTPENVGAKINNLTISAAAPVQASISNDPAERSESAVENISGERFAEQPPNDSPGQVAENITNVNQGGGVPADFKPETKEIEAPPPSGIMSRGWKWLLGLGLLPTTGAGAIESVKGFVSSETFNAASVFEVMKQVLIFLLPYLFWVAIAFIAFWGIKELLKQVSFIVNQYTLARGDMNNVKVLPVKGDWQNAKLPELPKQLSVVGKE